MSETENKNTALSKTSTDPINDLTLKTFDDYIIQIENITKFATSVVSSKQFTMLTKVEDAVACIMLALELGIPPMTALQLGTKLDNKATLSIQRGRELGLDWLTAIENVHCIPTKNGVITTTGVHIMNSVINTMGITYKFIRNFSPLYIYSDANKQPIYEKDILLVPERYYILSMSATAEEKQHAATLDSQGIIVVMKTNSIYTKGTVMEFTKKGIKTRFAYTLEDAKIAGLYIEDKNGNIGGKDNWIYHPGIMCTNRTIAIASRILAAEKLHRTYLSDEVSEIKITNDSNIDNDLAFTPTKEVKE